jgi:hypothetical protein
MILYRRVDPLDNVLFPPSLTGSARDSVISTSGDSYVSLSSNSKSPSGLVATERGLIAYAYDPSADGEQADEDLRRQRSEIPSISVLARFEDLDYTAFAVRQSLYSSHILSSASIHRSLLIVGNARINSTG